MQKATLKFARIFFASIFISLFFQACQEENTPTKNLADVSSYIYAFTSGVISKTTPVRIRFTQNITTEDKVGSEADKSLYKIAPKVEGKAIYENSRTLRFEPTNGLKSGTNYELTVRLSKIFDNVPRNASIFLTNFRTKDLRYDLSVEGLHASDFDDLTNQELHGEVFTADQADSEQVKKGLQAFQNGQNLDLVWSSAAGNTRHEFVVEGIKRGNSTSEVQLKWTGQPIGVDKKGQQVVSVPALNEFKVNYAEATSKQDPHIALRFTDPLLKSQELNGLIKINGYNGRLRFLIDGNLVKVYPSGRISGEKRVTVSPGIKNINGVKMPKGSNWNVSISATQPSVKLVGKGSIMPNSDGLIFPFEAVSLKAVDVEVVKVFDDNILQFLQVSSLSGTYDLERVGRIILQEKVNLADLNPEADPYINSRYAIDLAKLIDDDPYAIFRIRIGFRPAYSLYNCGEGEMGESEDLTLMESPFDQEGPVKSIWGDWYGIEGAYPGYEYSHRNNPCFPAYYNDRRFIQRNVLASDIGLIAKSGKDGSVMVAAADIRTTSSLPETKIDFYDYQQQLIKSMVTDSEGMVTTNLEREVFAVVATRGNQKGYLRMLDPNALSLSRFDVEGTVAQKGLKGYIYGERGVWRPGDSIYLNFVLEDKLGKLPANHPVNVELVDPKGQTQQQWTTSENVANVYPLTVATESSAPTGNWLAKVKVGGATFTKNVRVETVKPNRLKINFDLGKEEIAAADKNLRADLQVNWLHGAPAQNVRVKIEKQMRPINTTFKNFKEYEFDDPARTFSAEPQVVFDGKVNSSGAATVNVKRNNNRLFPGKYATSFNTRAFEKGGDFSSDQVTVKESPYDVYTGIYIKKNKYGEKRLDIGKSNPIEFIAVDEEGQPMSGRSLKVGLYRIGWRWWWDRGNDNISQYNSAKHFGSLESTNLRTNGKGEVDWNVDISGWGRYLVRVCDTQSGHCSGDIFYAGYPWDDGESAGNRDAASMLAFSADKETYNVGDQVELIIPSSGEGRALISIENGTKVVESYWTNTTNGETKFKFYATEDMTPTVYANVTLVQPHAQVKNDLPIRLYGVIPVNVEDKKTRLNPELEMPKVIEPEQTVTVKVSEDNGKPMAYTIAMVDEGLLDLTRFTTPNPWNSFYAREALGVKTWDLYDHVLGAYGGELERVLAIGGDAALRKSKNNQEANRFKPVVKHLGPFYLKKGATAKHQITVPNYVGSVRTMVVASNNGAYGSADKTTPVRKPLMVLATLPRVLGPTEELTLPVTVFAMENKVKNVQVKIEETSGLVRMVGGNQQQISFDKPGESLVNFNLQVGEKVGVATFKITATGGGESASQTVEIAIRNPNPFVTNIDEKVLQPGQSW
ncbi:MAG: MG2 domain-containing protein, partial [Bacteroidota bacterium]